MKKYPIVILPGWMLGSARFAPIVSEFKKQAYETFVVDFPGFAEGGSILKPWTLADYVTFLEEYLEKKRIKKAIFVAHSFGGRVALKMLSDKPELAESLILTGTPGYRSIHTTKLQFIAIISKIGNAFMHLPPLSIFQDVIRNIFHILIGARDISQLRGFMKQTFINIVEEDLEPYMKKLDIPTLLLWGAEDGLVSVHIAEKMQQVIQNAKLVIVPNVRHNFIYRNPDLFITEAVTFLDGSRGKSLRNT